RGGCSRAARSPTCATTSACSTSTSDGASMLRLEGVRAGYGGAPVLQGVDLRVEAGERVALLGRNGVGKTTLLRAIVGQIPLTGGRIAFDERDIGRMPSHRRARSGI